MKSKRSPLYKAASFNKYASLVLPIVVTVGIGISLVAALLIRDSSREVTQAQFEAAASERIAMFKQVMALSLLEVESIAAFFNASAEVSRRDFRQFVKPFLAHSRSIQALEWIPRVPDELKAEYEAKAREDNIPNFRFTERASQGNMVSVSHRKTYFPVYFVEPYTGNELAIGFDLASDPSRLDALNSSRDTEKLWLTEGITLVQESSNQRGFLAFLPIYQTPPPLPSIQERRKQLRGFVLGVFRIGDILQKAISSMQPVGVEFIIFDVSAPANRQFLASYSSAQNSVKQPLANEIKQEYQGTLKLVDNFRIGERDWQIVATPSEGYFGEGFNSLSQAAFIGGLLLTCLFTAYPWLLLTRYKQARQYAEQISESERQLQYLATHDALTKLVNRGEFEHRLKLLLLSVQQNCGHHSLLYLDLDQFKIVNDTCGHAAGDVLLRQITQTLKQQIRKPDTLARLGGDEFAVLLENCELEDAERTAEKLRLSVQNSRFCWQDKYFDIGVSIGVASISDTHNDIQQIMSTADMACYMAKDLGRNRIHTYVEGNTELVRQRGEMAWVSRLTSALNDQRFILYCQKIQSLTEAKVAHFEILVRFEDESGQAVLPDRFISAAERYDLMPAIDRLVIRNTLAMFETHPSFTESLDLCSINISGKSLGQADFLDYVEQELKVSRIPPSKICFEITETAVIANLEYAKIFISTLKSRGCFFALDDFGTGMSSFSYLKQLPVDFVKIDGRFVKDIHVDPVCRAMVKSIHDVAKVMKIKTTAEYVENEAILEVLKNIGVDYAQGYHIHIPVLLDEFMRSQQMKDNKKIETISSSVV